MILRIESLLGCYGYSIAPDKAFEMLCNQLFENWCKNEYGSSIASVHAVNGAGGDGGVESYAVLKDGNIIKSGDYNLAKLIEKDGYNQSFSIGE